MKVNKFKVLLYLKKSGLLCSPEHSKVCFLLHETPFAAQNSLLFRGA